MQRKQRKTRNDSRRRAFRRLVLGVALGVACFAAPSAYAQGVALRGIGAVNAGMSGVATATPVDAIGALQWNPATISALDSSEMSFGSGLIMADSSVSSGVNLPTPYGAMSMSGTTESDAGTIPAPYMGMVMKNPENPFTLGFSLSAIGGAQANYPSDPTNPVLNENIGIGRVSSKVELFQMSPTVSYQLTEQISVGFAPTVAIARLIAEPMFFGPQDSNGDWGKGAGTRYVWGGGFQGGLYIKGNNGFNYGISYKSKQYVEDFEYNVVVDGQPKVAKFKLEYPAIYSAGISYDGFQGTIIGVDCRYFDYENAKGFSDHGYNADGSIKGLGWDSCFSVATGIQRELNPYLTVRGGYCFNTNPISDEVALTNVPCPLIIQHTASVGATLTTPDRWQFHVAYAHAFENSVRGELSPMLPGSYVENTASAHELTFGIAKKF